MPRTDLAVCSRLLLDKRVGTMDGWIKLHRKILDNQFLKRDTNAFKVFAYLLLLVDRKTGIWSGGRFQLAEYCGLKPTTSYAASMRLVKAKMMTLVSNNKFSTYSISNWYLYQCNNDNTDDNKMTTRRQQDDTLTRSKEIKNKEIDSTYLSELQKEFPTKSVFKEYDKCKDWISANGKKYKDYRAMFRNWLRRSTDTRIAPIKKFDIELNQENIDLILKGKQCIPN